MYMIAMPAALHADTPTITEATSLVAYILAMPLTEAITNLHGISL